jgi:signal transduction protein with GAF and PtsI domain
MAKGRELYQIHVAWTTRILRRILRNQLRRGADGIDTAQISEAFKTPNGQRNFAWKQIEVLLAQASSLEPVLRKVLKRFHSETGTIHRLDAQTQLLHLVAQVGLPPQLLQVVKTIPVGKGIAGETVAKNRPVTLCNLQTDTSGVARPGAKPTGVGGAVCVPVRSGDKIVGTFGIGTRREHEYSAAEINALQDIANSLADSLK